MSRTGERKMPRAETGTSQRVEEENKADNRGAELYPAV